MLRRMLALPFGLALVALMPDALGDYKRGYVDGPFGQIHYHRAAPAAAGEKTPIAFFHQNPKSAWEFEYLLKAHTVTPQDDPAWVAFTYGPWALAETMDGSVVDAVGPFVGKAVPASAPSHWL